MMWLLESVLAVVFVGVAAFTGVVFGGPAGFLVFIACWVVTGAPVYYWNKARKTGRSGAYDDRLTDERMAKGREMVIAHFEKQREEDSNLEDE